MANSKTSVGLDENIEGLLCYVLGWVSGIVFLIIEKKSKFVKFHALQSIITFLALFVIGMVAGWIPVFGFIISLVLWPIQIILWILLIYKAYKGEMFKLPIVGDIAEKQANK